MHERFAVYLFLILISLLVSTSSGDIGQTQGLIMFAENGAFLSGAPGSAQNLNMATVAQRQEAKDPYNSATTIQSEGGMLVQGAYVAGRNGSFGVGQAGEVQGGQLQTFDGSQGIQDQFLNAGFAQDVAKIDGIGAALGVQGFIGVMVQLTVSPHGADTNIQYLGLAQVDGVGGGPN